MVLRGRQQDRQRFLSACRASPLLDPCPFSRAPIAVLTVHQGEAGLAVVSGTDIKAEGEEGSFL